MCRLGRNWLGVWTAMLFCLQCPNGASASKVFLRDGRVLEGKLSPTSGLAEKPKAHRADSSPIQTILVVDDELRRTFIPKYQVRDFQQDDPAQVVEKFRLRQPVARTAGTILSVGPVIRVTQFDEYGRRTLTMSTARGAVDIVQAITEITPLYAKVEGVEHVWDMRIATSSIPRDVLARILAKQTDPKNIEHRKKIARFYLQCERYKDAFTELEAILADFSGAADAEAIREQLEPSIRALKQFSARRRLDELELRRDAGQHRMVVDWLSTFPSEGVAGEILAAAREMLGEYETWEASRVEILQRFDALLAEIKDYDVRTRLGPIREEIRAELGFNTLGRMAAFNLMADDEDLKAEEKISLAVSGWLLGGEAATDNLAVALSVYQVRGLVGGYMNVGDKLSQARILEQLRSEEGATVARVARLVAHMKPPLETPAPAKKTPRFYRLEVPGLTGSPPVEYLVQLPPNYDPLRRYPAIVTLRGAGSTAAQQVDWWAGARAPGGMRLGQASRRGYIVISPGWAAAHQTQYEYSARECAAVLDSLRDACRRFAVDTDRVFLSGHSMGGDAAWDLGLSHPDLWAGVMPIVARADRYCAFYWQNAQLVPFYFVCGELDGSKMIQNARDLDRYLKHRYNTTVVEYRGRGHEHFSDDIQRLFDWMGRFRRDFYPREFEVTTMRPWDNFFWWVEFQELPVKSMVHPVDWPPPRSTQPARPRARLSATNGLTVSLRAGKVTVWLSPEIIDFDRPTDVRVNGRRLSTGSRYVEPDLETLLEDVRTRGDRQHPFWAKLETTGPARR